MPDQPLGLWTTGELRRRWPELVTRLVEQRFQVVDVRYRLLGEQSTLEPADAFADSQVTVTLEAPAKAGSETRVLQITADLAIDLEESAEALGLDVPGLEVRNLVVTAANDPTLESFIEAGVEPSGETLPDDPSASTP